MCDFPPSFPLLRVHIPPISMYYIVHTEGTMLSIPAYCYSERIWNTANLPSSCSLWHHPPHLRRLHNIPLCHSHLPPTPSSRAHQPPRPRALHPRRSAPLDGAYPHDHERHRKASLQHHASRPSTPIKPAIWHCKLRARRRGRNGGE